VWLKKRYILKWNGDQHTAVVATEGQRVEVAVDDRDPIAIDCVPVFGGRALSIRVGDRIHLVHLTGLNQSGEVAATLQGRPVGLTVLDELHALALESLGDAAGSGTLSADIPGVVIEVKVKEGQRVHQGEPLIVVEAMKMQNELTAGVAGTVVQVPVVAGQSVNPGDSLIVVEPEAGG
jgi:biotin carboxyl carrier protein